MTILHFETLSFALKGEYLKVTLLKLFSTTIPLLEIEEQLGPINIPDPNSIEFKEQKLAYKDKDKEKNKERTELKFSYLLDKYMDNLKTNLTGNKATYIHRNSDIPLIGNVAFGIVYRNSSIIEIKTNNACNLDCVYCSIGEGLSSKKNDFVIEKEYMVEELQKLIDFVDEPVEIHIGVQGEPFLYADMENLIEDIQKMELVQTISIDTNGTLLSKEKIDCLAKNTKLQFNLSLDAIDEDKAKKIAGTKNYNIKHVLEIIAYASEKMQKRPIVAPVFTLRFNEEELEKIIQFVKTIPNQPLLGIQNFLRYKTGRNPAPEMSWDDFYTLLEKLEKKYEIKLVVNKEDFKVRKTKELPKPFQEGDVITATIKAVDRFPKSIIAVAANRNISVPDCEFKKDKKIKIKICRDKHNIFIGKLI